MKKPLHASVQALLAECCAPTYAPTGDLAHPMRPIFGLVAQLQKQVAEYRRLLFEAQLDAPESDGDMERLHQTVSAMEGDLKALQDAARRVRISALQYERYAEEIAAEYAPLDAIIEPPNPDLTVTP